MGVLSQGGDPIVNRFSSFFLVVLKKIKKGAWTLINFGLKKNKKGACGV